MASGDGDRKGVNFADLQGAENVSKFKQELADVFKIRRLVMQVQKGEAITMEDLASIHRYICIETMIPTMPFWQLMPKADQLEACKKLKLQKAGIRGMDMTIVMNKLQSSINIMLKGQAFVVCVSTGGIWGNVVVGQQMLDYLAKRNSGVRMWEVDDNKTKLQFIMDEDITYRVFLNPRSEYLSLAHVDMRASMAGIQEQHEQAEILEEMGLGFLNENVRRRRRESRKEKGGGGGEPSALVMDSGRGSSLVGLGLIPGLFDIMDISRNPRRPSSSSARPPSTGRGATDYSPNGSPKSAASFETNMTAPSRRASGHRSHRVARFGRGAILLYQGETNISEVMVVTKGICRVVVDMGSTLPAVLQQRRAMMSSCQSRSYHSLTPVLIEDTGFETRLDLRTVALLSSKAVVGDIPAVLDVPQPAYIITETEVTALVFPKDDLREGLEMRPDLHACFRRAATENFYLVQRKLKALKEGVLIEDRQNTDSSSNGGGGKSSIAGGGGDQDLFIQLDKCKRIGDVFKLVDREIISLPAIDRGGW